MSVINYTFCDLDAVFPWLEIRLKILQHQGFKYKYQILLGDGLFIVELELTP